MIVCEEKKWVGGKWERIVLLLFYWIVCKNKNWNVGWVVKWVGKINKIVFKDAKWVLFCIPGC